MANTITSFTTFLPDTPARSSEVNTNFSNFRGDIIPVNENTTSSSDLTHDLGTTDHRWNFKYVKNLIFSDQTTSGLYLKGSDDGKAIQFYINNTVSGAIHHSMVSVQSSAVSFSVTSTTPQTVTGLVLSVTSYGEPMMVGFISATDGYVSIEALTTTLNNPALTLQIFRDLTLIGSHTVDIKSFQNTTTSLNTLFVPCNFFSIDNSATGNHTYSVLLSTNASTAKASLVNVKLFKYSLFGRPF